MAGNFKPTFWSKYCQTELKKDLVLANWCDYKFDGEIKVLNEQINSAKQNDEHIRERIASVNENIDKQIIRCVIYAKIYFF